MKKIILLILFFANIASGQNEVTTNYGITHVPAHVPAQDPDTIIVDSMYFSKLSAASVTLGIALKAGEGVTLRDSANFLIIDTALPNYDTIMVVMLVCDTSTYKPFAKYSDSKPKHITIQRYDYEVKWMYGYSVRETRNTEQNSNYRDYNIHICYLDIEKQPISPNIIVWNSIPL